METKDHYSLSKLLARRMQLNLPKTTAFVLGNVFPDFNPLSYLHGSKTADLNGHSYHARRHLIRQVYSSGFRDSVSGWFRAGEMMHYITDSFTRPHNKEFNFSFREHIRYERCLHLTFQNHLCPEQVRRYTKSGTHIRQFDSWLASLHQKYILYSSSSDDDCRYILHSAIAVCRGLTEKCTVRKLEPVKKLIPD